MTTIERIKWLIEQLNKSQQMALLAELEDAYLDQSIENKLPWEEEEC